MILQPGDDAFDNALLRPLLSRHGIFTQPFFCRAVRERAARRFSQMGISVTDFRLLLFEAWGYESNVVRNRHDVILRIVDHLYEQAMLRAISHRRVCREIEDWLTTMGRSRSCHICGQTFRVMDLPYWIYFGSDGYQDCCFGCRILSSPRKAEMMSLIPAFIASCGFVPRSDASPITYSFTSRLTTDKKPDAFRTYANMGGIEHVKKKFGTWFRALAETGALPEGALPTVRGVRCLAQDGHACHSLEEQRVDDWLSAHRIQHEREPLYPAHPQLNPRGTRRADWLVGDSYVEYFGLVGDPAYERKLDEKTLLAHTCGIALISIYPSDLEQLEGKLGHLARDCQ